MLNNFSNLTILYVEDDTIIRNNAISYLENYFKTVFEASDGEEAFEIYEEEQPDIIITDIKMPKLNGLDLVKKIRKSDKKTPVILITAHTDTEYLLQAIELQLIKYVIKPITEEKLQEALGKACEALSGITPHTLLINKHISYDTLNQTLLYNKTPIKLTYNELQFFDLLTKNIQRTVSYKEIENHIWTYEGMSMDALRSLVRSLRKKIPDIIENQSGIGYKLKVTSQ